MDLAPTIIVFWIILGTLEYGINFAYLQRKFPEKAKLEYKEDMLWAIIISFSFPIGAFIVSIWRKEYQYGLKFW